MFVCSAMRPSGGKGRAAAGAAGGPHGSARRAGRDRSGGGARRVRCGHPRRGASRRRAGATTCTPSRSSSQRSRQPQAERRCAS